MKIEIDLNDILGDEYGSETLQDSIRRQVVESLTTTITKGIGKQIDSEVSKVIDEQLALVLAEKMPDIICDLLSAEYQPVDKWGSKSGPVTTLRTALIESITSQMVYKKSNYESDKNVFTKAVDSIISEQMKIISEDYKKTVNETIGKEAFALAINTLKTKLGL
jgi:hypothetical protein